MRILISNAMNLPAAGSPTVGSRVDIGIEDGKILFIEEHTSPDAANRLQQGPWDRIIAGRGRLALPGLVNAHTHLGMTMLRGYGDDLPLMVWLQERMWPVEDQLSPEDIYWSALLAIGEMLKGGVTTCADMYFHMEAAVQAAVETGIRASLSRGIQDIGGSGLRGLEEAAALCREWQGAADGRITTALGPHAPYTCSPGILQRVADVAARLDVPIHIHAAETRDEAAEIAAKYGRTPLEMLADNGILDVPVTAAHCVHLEEGDISLAAEKNVKIIHCPTSNLKLGSGIAPVPKMLAAGLTVGLGTDSAASNNRLDVWQEMRMAALLHKGTNEDPTAVPAGRALQMATYLGAEALHLERVGKLLPGWKADLILVDTDGLHWQPDYEPIGRVVYAGERGDVSLVMVNGRVLYENGNLLTIDEELVRHQVEKRAQRLGLLPADGPNGP
ncbi:MAG: amidohydrolase [Firmicutes bacterium]|jgi:5-methylthioadenosine/S-adenosylhomocysteine deaminase|nr:amidohydrolase [Bacillota bacterium]